MPGRPGTAARSVTSGVIGAVMTAVRRTAIVISSVCHRELFPPSSGRLPAPLMK